MSLCTRDLHWPCLQTTIPSGHWQLLTKRKPETRGGNNHPRHHPNPSVCSVVNPDHPRPHPNTSVRAVLNHNLVTSQHASQQTWVPAPVWQTSLLSRQGERKESTAFTLKNLCWCSFQTGPTLVPKWIYFNHKTWLHIVNYPDLIWVIKSLCELTMGFLACYKETMGSHFAAGWDLKQKMKTWPRLPGWLILKFVPERPHHPPSVDWSIKKNMVASTVCPAHLRCGKSPYKETTSLWPTFSFYFLCLMSMITIPRHTAI